MANLLAVPTIQVTIKGKRPPNIHRFTAAFIIGGLGHLNLGETIQRREIVWDSKSEVMFSAVMQALELQPTLLDLIDSSSADPSNSTKTPPAHVMDRFITNVTANHFSNRYFL